MTAKHLSAKLARTLGATALCAAFGTPAALATTIDLLLVYDSTATSWVSGKGGMAAFSQEAVNRMNQVAQNSGLDLTFRIVHTMTASYTTATTAQTCPDTDFDALSAGQGAFAAVHQARDTYGADLVAMLVDSGSAYGCVGLGDLLMSWNGSPNAAFTVNVVQAVEISSTLTHEVGHNLGADHSKFQKSGPGPNTHLADYAAGWYFKGSNGTAYHTIMGYNDDGYGNEYQPAPLFSTPLKNYEGTPAGDAKDGDNTRLIAQTKDIVAAYRNSTQPPPPPPPPSDYQQPLVQSGDYNGDKRADLIWQDGYSGLVRGVLLNGFYELGKADFYTEENTAWKIVGNGDFNGDGKSDLLWRNMSDGMVYVMLMDGLKVAGGQVVYVEPNQAWQIVAVGDLNGDRKSDLIWWNSQSGLVYGMLMNGYSITAQAPMYQDPDTSWRILAASDFDGDGKADLLWRNVRSGYVYLMPMNGLQVTGGQMIYYEPNLAWSIVAVNDFNRDKRADLIWWNSNSGDFYGMLMNGGTVVSGRFFYHEADTNWQVVASGDYNGDGHSDLYVRNISTNQFYQMELHNLQFVEGNIMYTQVSSWRIAANATPLNFPTTRSVAGTGLPTGTAGQ